MAATGYSDVPVRPFPLDPRGRDTERVLGMAQVVIERNEGNVEVFLTIPKGSGLYEALAGDAVLTEFYLDAMVDPRG